MSAPQPTTLTPSTKTAVAPKPSPHLPTLFLTESLSAVSSATLVAPFIKIIDASIFANASGKEKLGSAILGGVRGLVCRPWVFFRQTPFLLVWAVYTTTYLTANLTETICTHLLNYPPFYPKFLAASTTNVIGSVLKDMYFTKYFAKTTTARRVPLASNILYTSRDVGTIFASFNLPPIVAAYLPMDAKTAATVSQLLTPCAIQFFTSPSHLLGMDLYNRPGRVGLKERVGFIGKEYVKTSLARVGRIFPAYGIGGVVNTWLRGKGREWEETDRKR